MEKKIYTSKELFGIFKRRLNSQRRIFNFDDKQIIVLPFIEHQNMDESIQKIKFLNDNIGNHILFQDIKRIEVNNRKVEIIDSSGLSFFLHQRLVNGDINELVLDQSEDVIRELTIEHVPSIQIVLLTQYLSETKEFEILSKFTSDFKMNYKKELNVPTVKSKGFKNDISDFLQAYPSKNDVISAYSSVFNYIDLEILHISKNNANLGLSSLKYFNENYNKKLMTTI